MVIKMEKKLLLSDEDMVLLSGTNLMEELYKMSYTIYVPLDNQHTFRSVLNEFSVSAKSNWYWKFDPKSSSTDIKFSSLADVKTFKTIYDNYFN